MSEMKKPFLAAATRQELQDFILSAGESKFRADQVYQWVTRKWVCDPDAMTNLSASVKTALKEHFITNGAVLDEHSEAGDGSGKYLIRLHDGETVECASIPAEDGRITFCLSSQVGCPVRCAFCVSGGNGLVRNLDAGEIIEEFLLLCRLAGKTPDNIVMMGVGEPLLNYTNLEKALDTICDPDGIGVAQRRITISTSGWTPGIRNLAEHGKQKNKNNIFCPPTVDEVQKYIHSVGSKVDAEAFVAFYESKGWVVGKNKMKNWKSAIVTWEKRNGLKRTAPKVVKDQVVDDDEIYKGDDW